MRHAIFLTDAELQSVIDLVDARLQRQYNEQYQTILNQLEGITLGRE